MSSAALLGVVGIIAFAVTFGARRYALAYRVLDIPNERSGHSKPTPRGGGIAIVVAFLAGLGWLSAAGRVDLHVLAALAGAGALVAMIGFIDDHVSIGVVPRLAVHFAAAAWALYWLGGVAPIEVAGPLIVGWPALVMATVAIVWLLNLYNFMDGIDGIAGLEAVTVGLGASLLYLSRAELGAEWLLPALLAASSLGFLIWNWPPARIFMGDVGSGFLGLLFGVLAVRATWLAPPLVWVWIILSGVFIVDATVTLVARLLRREKPHEGHREHVYQTASDRLSPRTVTMAVGAINVVWLLPIAAAVNFGAVSGPGGVAIAYAPLVGVAIRFQSRRP
jgi:Fuc2NAc and GlcNAc transferase